MKNVFVLVVILFPLLVNGQAKPVKIVFDVTSGDTLTHQAVLRHVNGMAQAYPDALLEVVIYGGAWPLAVSDNNHSADNIEELSKKKNVSFKVCGVTLERYGVEPAKLVTGVEVVPDAIIEIVTRQNEGWGYIKESHN